MHPASPLSLAPALSSGPGIGLLLWVCSWRCTCDHSLEVWLMQSLNMDYLATGLYVKRCTGFTSARGMPKQLSHNWTVVLMVILALSHLWNSRHQGGISISPEPYVPSMEKWSTCKWTPSLILSSYWCIKIESSCRKLILTHWWPWKWVLPTLQEDWSFHSIDSGFSGLLPSIWTIILRQFRWLSNEPSSSCLHATNLWFHFKSVSEGKSSH